VACHRPSVKGGFGGKSPKLVPRRDGQVRRDRTKWVGLGCHEKPLASDAVPVPQTDTGRQVEHTKVDGRPFVKELGNMAP
jgi:hypothetical protein